MATKRLKRLFVEFDVTELDRAEIGRLKEEARQMAEPTDGMGGAIYHGEEWGHRAVPILDIDTIRQDRRDILRFIFDTSKLKSDEVSVLEVQAAFAGESSEGRPAVGLSVWRDE
jgi:hypothetical protein